jgi:hypothetical protein
MPAILKNYTSLACLPLMVFSSTSASNSASCSAKPEKRRQSHRLHVAQDLGLKELATFTLSVQLGGAFEIGGTRMRGDRRGRGENRASRSKRSRRAAGISNEPFSDTKATSTTSGGRSGSGK